MSTKKEKVFSEQEVSALDQFVDRAKFDKQMEAIAKGEFPIPVPRAPAEKEKTPVEKASNSSTLPQAQGHESSPAAQGSEGTTKIMPPVKGQLPGESPASSSLRDALIAAEQLAVPAKSKSLLDELAEQKTDDEDGSEYESDDDEDKEEDPITTVDPQAAQNETQAMSDSASKPFDWAEDDISSEMTKAIPPATTSSDRTQRPWRDPLVKDKGPKKIFYESSSAGDPPAPIGMFKSAPSSELTRPSDGNFFVSQIASHQAEIVLQRQMIDSLQKELKLVQKELSQTKIEVQSIRVLCVQMSDRITEFDKASLQIIDRAASLVQKGAQVTAAERSSMELEAAKAQKSIESRSAEMASKPLISNKQRKKKTFNFE